MSPPPRWGGTTSPDAVLPLIALVVLFLAATLLCATAAGAFFGLDRVERVRLEQDDGPGGIGELLRDPRMVRGAFDFLVGVSEVGFAVSVVLLDRALFPEFDAFTHGGIALLVSLVMLFVLGEVPARALGARHAEPVARRLTPFYHGVLAVTRPLRALSSTLLPNRERSTTLPLSAEVSGTIDGAELRTLVSESVEAGTVEQQEQALIHNVLDFGDRRVRDVMTPFDRVFSVPEDLPVPEVTRLVAERKYSRVPVWRRDPHRIVGVLYAKDLLPIRWGVASPRPLKRLVRRPLFVVPQMRAQVLLEQFKRHRLHIAVVVDEVGRAVGVCTMEDLLEELVGPITDLAAERKGEEPVR